MKRRSLCWMAGAGILVLAASAGAGSNPSVHGRFEGVISDHTPQDALGGPWEIRGVWSLTVKGHSVRADFSAALAMELSDLGTPDLNDPAARVAHTHHITLVNAAVTSLSNGFRVSGPATITGNGKYPPPFGGSSTVQVDVTGGNSVPFSNVALTFGGDAANHFGTQLVHGVVSSFSPGGDHEGH
jgi:hypothetical protein